MKFRTDFPIRPLSIPISLHTPVLALGSCFAKRVAGRLEELHFPVTTNPLGVLFNPVSVAATLQRFAANKLLTREELQCGEEGFFHDDLQGMEPATDPQEALERMNQRISRGAVAFRKADLLMITFGTARVYVSQASGRVVANCHKLPRAYFSSRLLTVEEIVNEWEALLAGPLAEKRVLFTLSPVRHIRDGAEENSLSKAILRVAIAQLVERHARCEYFPAAELLLDDLRDYRFYADDLVHPAPAAVNYIWERFVECCLDKEARDLLPRIEALRRATEHRPLNPASEAWRQFCSAQLHEAETLEELLGLDFSAEKAHFKSNLP